MIRHLSHWRPRTLRSQIRALVVGSVVVVLLLLTVPITLLLHRAAADDVRQSAYDTARAVADYLSTGVSAADAKAYVERSNSRDDAVAVTVVTNDKSTFGAPLPEGLVLTAEQFKPREGDPDRDGDGDGPRFLPTSELYVEPVSGGDAVCVEVRSSGGPDTVVALMDDGRVRTLVLQRLALLALAGVVLAALAAAVAEVISRRLVRDLAGAADVADSVAGGDLTARVPDRGAREVRRVAQALNGLAERIDDLLIAERETVADLSHRLRTPVAALRLDIESLESSGIDLPVDLSGRLDQLERTLTAVIRQARRVEREGVRPAADPSTVVAEAVEFWTPLIDDQGRSLAVDVAVGLPQVKAAAADLRAAVDALLENCVAHTPEGTPIEVSALADGPDVVVRIADRGPGLPGDLPQRGRSDRDSTGLGLDIARSCAQASGGRLELDRTTRPDGEWTVVTLRLGPA